MRSPVAWPVALALGTLLLVTLGCQLSPSKEEDPAAVVERFLAARAARNLDATMDCFSEQPEMRNNLGVGWSGRDAVRAIMAYRVLDLYSVSDLRAAGNRVIWTEHVRRGATGVRSTSFDEDVEVHISGGRIASLVTYVGDDHPAPIITVVSADMLATSSLLVPLSVLVLVLTAITAWPGAPALHRPRVTEGHLMSELRDYVARRG